MDQRTDILMVSLTINLFVVVFLVVSWIIRRRRGNITAAETGDLHDMGTSRGLQAKYVGSCSKPTLPKSTLIFTVCEVIGSVFCVGAGLYLSTSSIVWRCPFVCPSGPSGSLPSSQEDADNAVMASTSLLLSMGLGRFIFTLFHLTYASSKSGRWSLWSATRIGYLAISVMTVGTILATNENILGGSLVLLMEADAVVDGLCHLIDRIRPGKRLNMTRTVLPAIGCAISVATRIVTTWVISILLIRRYNPMEMNVLSLGVCSFAFIFYQAYTVIVIKQHMERMRSGKGEEVKPNSIISYHGHYQRLGSGRTGGKNIAFYLMNEGLLEISSYAKTVAGAIKCKKLLPIKQICDSFMPVKPEHNHQPSKLQLSINNS